MLCFLKLSFLSNNNLLVNMEIWVVVNQQSIVGSFASHQFSGDHEFFWMNGLGA